jgi:hypothetical protein
MAMAGAKLARGRRVGELSRAGRRRAVAAHVTIMASRDWPPPQGLPTERTVRVTGRAAARSATLRPCVMATPLNI